jgi:restriction system protein
MEQTARMKKIDKMKGRQFDKFLQCFFTQQGYFVKKTKTRHQQGTDFILIQRNIRITVEAKRWNNKVGNRAVQQTNSGKSYYKCDQAWVITNNYFTPQAKELAKSCNIELIDRNILNYIMSQTKLQ